MKDLSGGKTQKRRPRKTPEAKITPDVPSRQDRKAACAVQGDESAMGNRLSPNCYPSTPKQDRRRSRQRREAYLTSTPVHRSSTAILSHTAESLPRAKQVDLEYTELITQLKVFVHTICFSILSLQILQLAQLLSITLSFLQNLLCCRHPRYIQHAPKQYLKTGVKGVRFHNDERVLERRKHQSAVNSAVSYLSAGTERPRQILSPISH